MRMKIFILMMVAILLTSLSYFEEKRKIKSMSTLPSTITAIMVPSALSCATNTLSLEGSFPLGVYWPWERTEALAKRNGLEKWAFVEHCLDDLKANSFDTVWAVNLTIPDLLGLLQRMASRGMKLVPALAELHYKINWRRNNWTYLENESKRAFKFAGASPAILAWSLCDEPHLDLVNEMEMFRRKFIEWGAKQPVVVVTMWRDSPVYAEQSGFSAVCTDIYPFFSTGNPNGPNTPVGSRSWYRRHVQITAQVARKANRTPWIMPQCFMEIRGPWKYDEHMNVVMLPGAILNWRQPSLGEVRWQVWSAIGAGVKGFFWFVFLPPPKERMEAQPYVGPVFPSTLAVKEATPVHATGGMLRADGGATPEYLTAAEAFAALKPLLPLLTGAVPTGSPFSKVSAPGWIGGLTNTNLKRTFAVVVNDDTDHEQTLNIYLLKPHDVRNLRTGQVLKRLADNTVAVKLGPGDGTLLEMIPPCCD